MLTKMKATGAVDTMDGQFSTGEEFWVNDERRFALVREGVAEVSVDQSPEAPAVPDVAAALVAPIVAEE